MRYHAIPQTVFFRNAGRTTPRTSWRVIDVDAGMNERAWPRKLVATANDEVTARRIADMLNGTNLHASHWQAQAETARRNALALETRWQATLDHTNGLLREAREAADILRKQLFEARDQRDEARADARNAWAELKKQPPAYSATLPGDHVVMSLANYSKLVTERDEALAKYAACVDIVSFVDGRWVKTS